MSQVSSKVVKWLENPRSLAPFQRRFVRRAFRAGIHKAVLSGPRGIGKSSLSGDLLAASLHPDGPLFVSGGESVLLAASLGQARTVFRFLRARLGEDGFRYSDSGQRISATHEPTSTRVRVASSDSKRAFGIAGARLIVGDEPGAWQDRGGALMYDALETSGGKNECLLVLIGTRAPGPAGGWWRNLVDHEDDPATYVQVHDAPVDGDGEVIAWVNLEDDPPGESAAGLQPFPPVETGRGAPEGEAVRKCPAPVHQLQVEPAATGRADGSAHG